MGKCVCKCNEKGKSEEKEIYNEEDIKRLEETFNKANLNSPVNSNYNDEINKKNNELYNIEYGIDLNEPLIEVFEYDNYLKNENNIYNNQNKNNGFYNLKSQKNTNSSNSNKLNSEVDGGISSPNILNNNSIKHLKKKGVNQNTLSIFNISKKNTFNKNNNNTINNDNNKLIRKVLTQSQNHNNIPKNEMIEGINNLNEIFLNQRNSNYKLNDNWKNLDINNFISSQKLNSINHEEILFSSNINKLVLSSLFRICSMNIEEFLILIQDKLLIYQNKENFLLMKKPQREFDLNKIEHCGRVDLTLLNFSFLKDYFYMYIEINDVNNKENINDNNDIIYKIIQKEQQGNFFVFFSKDELLINQWVRAINCFIKPLSKQNTV